MSYATERREVVNNDLIMPLASFSEKDEIYVKKITRQTKRIK